MRNLDNNSLLRARPRHADSDVSRHVVDRHTSPISSRNWYAALSSWHLIRLVFGLQTSFVTMMYVNWIVAIVFIVLHSELGAQADFLQVSICFYTVLLTSLNF